MAVDFFQEKQVTPDSPTLDVGLCQNCVTKPPPTSGEAGKVVLFWYIALNKIKILLIRPRDLWILDKQWTACEALILNLHIPLLFLTYILNFSLPLKQ